MADSNVSINRFVRELRLFLKDRFNLYEGEAGEHETIEEIKKGIVFKGANLWILIFAIMVCSVGLNVNSTAVIIGAMLISPLMGPIMGVGLGIGIYDFELIVRALKNLGIAIVISVLTSALYFWASPLDDAQSELLARTSPNLWDVFIALFGGLAGIVAGSRKEKTNAIPGVAIATALMPPLCTAGYGLATGQWYYFLGAFYLFFINSVFISLSTYMIVRALRYSKKEFVDPAREKRVKRYIGFLVFLIIIPSALTAYNLVSKSIFQSNANAFINNEIVFENSQIIFRKLNFNQEGKSIEVTLYGEPVSQEDIEDVRKRMDNYALKECELIIRQGHIEEKGLDIEDVELMNKELRAGIIEDIYKKNEELLQSKESQIQLLEDQIFAYKSRELPIADMAQEVKAINSRVKELSITSSIISRTDSAKLDTVYLAYMKFSRRPGRSEIRKLETWLKARVKSDKLRLLTQ